MNRESAPRRSGWPLVAVGPVTLLEADPGLADHIPPGQIGAARRLVAPAFRLRRGWLPPYADSDSGNGNGRLGLLIVDGLLLREVVVFGRPTAELLGPGDLIRPWPTEHAERLLPRDVSWTAVEQTTVVDLGPQIAAHLAEVPAVVETLIERSISRAQENALERAIASQVRVDVRLLACLWRLAERWGVVTPGAVRIDIPLTHALLARMVGARRPTVTTALQRLTREGHLNRVDGRFVLTGDASVLTTSG